jgi:hypothetical protein
MSGIEFIGRTTINEDGFGPFRHGFLKFFGIEIFELSFQNIPPTYVTGF